RIFICSGNKNFNFSIEYLFDMSVESAIERLFLDPLMKTLTSYRSGYNVTFGVNFPLWSICNFHFNGRAIFQWFKNSAQFKINFGIACIHPFCLREIIIDYRRGDIPRLPLQWV